MTQENNLSGQNQKEKNIDKIIRLKNTISILYEKEGRSKSYISRLLELDRKLLTNQIKEWGMVQGNSHFLTPSTKKFINKNSSFIVSQLEKGTPITEIAKQLNISRDKLNYIIEKDDNLTKAKNEANLNKINKKISKGQEINYFEDLPNEIWKPILGFDGYFVSNMGRFKKYLITYNCYTLLTCAPNSRNGRLYIALINNAGKTKNLIAARVVGHAFCEGYSETNNTIDHLDNDFTNNKAENLQWVPQSINNERAYKRGKNKAVGYKKNGKFKEIVLNDKYSFKTITALAKFLGVSETQVNRYITGECSFDGKIKLIY